MAMKQGMVKSTREHRALGGVRTMISAAACLLVLAFAVAGLMFYSAHTIDHTDHHPSHPSHSIHTVQSNHNSPASQSTHNNSKSLHISQIAQNHAVVARASVARLGTIPSVSEKTGEFNAPRSDVKEKVSAYSSVADDVDTVLRNHPIHRLTRKQRRDMSLEEHFVYLKSQSQCKSIPIFTSMANVFSDMYWQL